MPSLRCIVVNVYLAGTCSRQRLLEKHTPLYVLESFFYVEPWQIKEMHKWKGFLLDSGAFTFMVNGKGETHFDEYVEKYVHFINKNNIERFLELDIDSVVGYDKVKKYRAYIEKNTGKQCIPVWHKSRGIEEYKKTVSEYKYVAIGGIVTKEITRKQWIHFPTLINIAHKSGAMVHGLGFTSTRELKKYHFDSVDSTNWLSASRFGTIQCFKGGLMKTVKTPDGKVVKHYKVLDDFVFGEWVKYQKYAESCL